MPTWVYVGVAIVLLVLAWRFLARPWLDQRGHHRAPADGSARSAAEERRLRDRNFNDSGNPSGG